jgi:UDP-N-acetylglucosamine 3-dehydrogenase
LKKLNVAVIGCGYFGNMHAQVYAQMEEANLLGVADISPEKARETAERLGTAWYTDYTELLKQDVDIVDICVPDSMHADVVCKAVEHNKHIFIEKPLADSMASANKIMEACKGYNKKVMIGHICRFDIRYEKAYEAIKNGELGEIIYITSKRNSPIEGGRRYAKYCKLITHSGVHDLDLIRWFTGSEYKNVYAVGRQVRMVNEGFPDTYDSVQAIFTLENGVTYTLENTWALPSRFPSYIDAGIQIVGTKAALFIDFADQGYNIATDNEYIRHDVSYWTESFGIRVGDLRHELKHFVDCVRYDKKPRASIEDGYAVSLAAIRALDSIKLGNVVDICEHNRC